MAVSLTERAATAGKVSRIRATSVPWIIPAVVFSSTAIVTGLLWDIAWHRSVGRDTLFTPPHDLEYLAALLAGLGCGFIVLRTTWFGTEVEKAAAVRFWGFRGPLGAWVCIWGALAMGASAPFDDWWHNAYGLDVKIVSPPHMVLLAGMMAIQVGAMLMVLSEQNRRSGLEGHGEQRLAWLYAASLGLLVLLGATAIFEYTAFPNLAHSRLYYQISGALFPLLLVAAGRAGRLRWPAATAAACYMGLSLLASWVLQLVPAIPKLAPIYNPLTHLVPPPFPLVLVVPALALDLLLRRLGTGRDWLLSVLLGVTFVGVFLAVQWTVTGFLLSPAARSWVFAVDQWDYNVRIGPWRYEFWDVPRTAGGAFDGPAFAKSIGFAALFAVVSSRVALWWGNWMARVRR